MTSSPLLRRLCSNCLALLFKWKISHMTQDCKLLEIGAHKFFHTCFGRVLTSDELISEFGLLLSSPFRKDFSSPLQSSVLTDSRTKFPSDLKPDVPAMVPLLINTTSELTNYMGLRKEKTAAASVTPSDGSLGLINSSQGHLRPWAVPSWAGSRSLITLNTVHI